MRRNTWNLASTARPIEHVYTSGLPTVGPSPTTTPHHTRSTASSAFYFTFTRMPRFSAFSALALALCGTAVVANPVAIAAPQVTAAPSVAEIEKRATACTFSGSAGAAAASKSKASCATIVLSSVAVPSGTTLDLTGLKQGTQVYVLAVSN